MADINVYELGPVDYLVGGFPADRANVSGAMAAELKTRTARTAVPSPRTAASIAPGRAQP
jgi:hypothetical protein